MKVTVDKSGQAFFPLAVELNGRWLGGSAMPRPIAAILPLGVPVALGAIIFTSAGRWDLPFVWAILCMLGVFYLALGAFADPGMMRERLAPGPGNQDQLTRSLGGAALLGHWVLVGLDAGRFHWDGVPWEVQVAGSVGYAAALGLLFWAMRANPFYSSVVRVQTERGHHAVAKGPYQFVRHPGYAATLFAMLSGGAALGSLVGMVPLLAFFGLFIRRTLLEDRLLQQELPGYAEYAQKVRYRLIAGLF
jgi:protein-S-isoprenylcysteine O-methyltransferase Ste14